MLQPLQHTDAHTSIPPTQYEHNEKVTAEHHVPTSNHTYIYPYHLCTLSFLILSLPLPLPLNELNIEHWTNLSTTKPNWNCICGWCCRRCCCCLFFHSFFHVFTMEHTLRRGSRPIESSSPTYNSQNDSFFSFFFCYNDSFNLKRSWQKKKLFNTNTYTHLNCVKVILIKIAEF